MKIKKVKPSDYANLLKKYGYVPSNSPWEHSKLRLKNLNFENAPEVKKALDGLDISKCNLEILSSTVGTDTEWEEVILLKPLANLNAIRHYVSSYTTDRGDIPIGVFDGDCCNTIWFRCYSHESSYNKVKNVIEEFFNKKLPEAIKAARELWDPSMKDFAMEIYKRKIELEAAKRGLQETKNRFYKSLKKKQQLLKDFKD